MAKKEGCLGPTLKFAAIVAAIVIIGPWVWHHLVGDSDDGCSSASGAVAHAVSDECAELNRAATDPSWAREQQATIRGQRLTTGRYITSQSSTVQTITSGSDDLSALADQYLRDSGDFDYPSSGKPAVIADVETKVATAMRRDGATGAVVAINHPQVCDGVLGCIQAVPAILPKGSVLLVWERDATTPVRLAGKANS